MAVESTIKSLTISYTEKINVCFHSGKLSDLVDVEQNSGGVRELKPKLLYGSVTTSTKAADKILCKFNKRNLWMLIKISFLTNNTFINLSKPWLHTDKNN